MMDIRMASPLYVIVHVSLNVPVLQTIAYTLYKHADGVYRSLEVGRTGLQE